MRLYPGESREELWRILEAAARSTWGDERAAALEVALGITADALFEVFWTPLDLVGDGLEDRHSRSRRSP